MKELQEVAERNEYANQCLKYLELRKKNLKVF